eukprot:3753125-Amphidinium_carterae.2
MPSHNKLNWLSQNYNLHLALYNGLLWYSKFMVWLMWSTPLPKHVDKLQLVEGFGGMAGNFSTVESASIRSRLLFQGTELQASSPLDAKIRKKPARRLADSKMELLLHGAWHSN